MEYIVIENKDLKEFQKAITELLNNGWTCMAGISVDNDVYRQALVHYGHSLLKS